MTDLSFEAIQAEIQHNYQAEQYAKALDLVNQYSPQFPEQAPLFTYWEICFQTRLGHIDLALQSLSDTLMEGNWYNEVLLRKSPALEALQGHTKFKRLVDINLTQQRQDQEELYPLITLRPQGECQAGGSPCPLLLALHPNASLAQDSLDFWRPAAGAGWLVAAPQATQAMWKGAYVWDDLETTASEIQKHHQSLVDSYAVDLDRIVLVGHGMGAEAAIWLALSGALRVTGFLAINPVGSLTKEPEDWRPWIENLQNSLLQGVVIVGEETGSTSLSSGKHLVEILLEAGIPATLDVIPDASQPHQPEFENSLLKALDQLIEEF